MAASWQLKRAFLISRFSSSLHFSLAGFIAPFIGWLCLDQGLVEKHDTALDNYRILTIK